MGASVTSPSVRPAALVLAGALVGLACSSEGSTAAGGGAGGLGTAGSGGTPSGGAASGGSTSLGGGGGSVGGSGGGADRPLRGYAAGDVVETSIRIPDIPPGGEATVCVRRKLDNDAALAITEVRGFIDEGSHHMIIDRSSGPEELEPFECGDLQGTDDSRMLIAQQKETVFSLPEGVAFSLDAEQVVTIEMHYINTTNQTIEGGGRVEFQVGGAPAETYTPATMLFTGNFGFTLPPLTQTDVEHFRSVGQGEPMRLFAITSHTHALGVRATIERATSADAPGELIHESLEWAEPPLDRFDPPLLFDGTDGLRLTCSFDNTRDESVSFGTRFESEMCFMWLYLFPDP